MKRIWRILLLLAFAFGIVANLEAKLEKNIIIKLAIGTNTTDLDFTKEQVKVFEKENPGIKVQILRLSNSATDNYAYVLQMLEAKSSDIDIFAIASAWNGDLASNLVDLYKYSPKDIDNKFMKNALNMSIVDGRLVSYPWNVDCGLLYYRSDLLKKYNLKVPTTWMELTKAANTIQQGEFAAGNKDFVGYVWQGNAYEGLTCNALEWIASNDGGTVVNENKKITINNPNAVKAIELAARWIGTISPKGVLSMQEEECRLAFQTGNAAFMRNWPYCYPLMKDKDSIVKDKFDVATLPAGIGGKFKSTLSGWGLGINKYSKHPEAAAKLLQSLTTTDFETRRSIIGAIPTVSAVYKEKAFKDAVPFYKIIEDSIDNGVPCPATQTAPYYNQVSALFYKAVYSVLTGTKSADTALAELSKEISSTTGFKIAK